MRLTRQNAAIAQRLMRIANHSAAEATGLVIASELAAMEHHVEQLCEIVTLQAVKKHNAESPHRAPSIRRSKLPLSTEVAHNVEIEQLPIAGARQ